MQRVPPGPTRTATLVPYTTLFRSGPEQLGAAVIAGEVDHPARMAGRELRDDRDRLILHGVALPVIHHGAQAIAAAHVALVHHAALRLPYGLARVEEIGRAHV